MGILETIKKTQKEWANERNLPLQGSAGERGDKIYTMDLSSNLFLPLSNESFSEFESGDGHEVLSIDGKTPRMQALHSSSALVVNVFEYWKQNKEYSTIAKLLGINDKNILNMKYEKQFAIFNKPANIDVCFEYSDNSVVAIESKYTEPYDIRDGKKIFVQRYFDEKDVWDELPNLFELANMINKNEVIFEYLNAPQLMKHIIGLQKAIKNKEKYKLIYIFFPSFNKNPEMKHEIEIMAINEVMKFDKIDFVYLSWVNVINKLHRNLKDIRKKYMEYIMDRYINRISNFA